MRKRKQNTIHLVELQEVKALHHHTTFTFESIPNNLVKLNHSV